MTLETFDYRQYLTIKQKLDDRSLNPAVWSAFADWNRQVQSTAQPMRILEIGAGIATMLERLLDAGLLLNAVYTALEIRPEFRDAARTRLQSWCKTHTSEFTVNDDNFWSINHVNSRVVIHWLSKDAIQAIEQFTPGSFDLLLGHAVIDLLPVPLCLPKLLSCLADAGAYYFSINYAGNTEFQPSQPLDAALSLAYHQDMDNRFSGIDWQASRTGELLGACLSGHGYPPLFTGASDWLISAADEDGKVFIGNILDTIAAALPELPGISAWLSIRRQQLQTGQLQFRAANRDYFGLKNS